MRKGLGGNYNRLWLSSALSNFGDGIFKFALPLLAADLTRSPFRVSLVSTFLSLPWLFFALPAGALADRLDRRRTMMQVNSLRAFVLAAVTVATFAESRSLILLLVIALALGIGETLFDTAGQALVPGLVDHSDLARANGRLFATEDFANTLIGPAVGGILVGIAFEYAFAVSAVSFAYAAVVLMLISGIHRVDRSGLATTTVGADIKEGLNYLLHNPMLRTLALMVALANMAFSAAIAILPLWAEGEGTMLGLTKLQYGLLFSVNAAGGLVAAYITNRYHRMHFRSTLLIGMGCIILMPLGLAATTNLPAVIGVFFVSGFGILLWDITTVSARQRVVPDRLLGRVNSAYRLVSWGSIPIASMLAGVVGEVFGLRAVFWMSTGFAVAAMALFLLLPKHDIADAYSTA